ncbi:hypothetical protein [Streptomyces sp. NPDC051001]|uniref:hypothetical protein n=1 Tax=Streptomyces sp. NPDC051001 TaxID=3155795 RepID=UPI00343EFB39
MGSNVRVSGSLGSIGPVSVNPVTVDGIPSDFRIAVTELPRLQLGVEPITLNPVTADLRVAPLDLNLSVKELPETRTHLPADFTMGFSLLGLPLFAIRLCGEAQAITEAYRPGPCESCGGTG